MKEFFLYDNKKEKKIYFKNMITIGRSDSSDLKLSDRQVSSQHAQIQASEGGVYLVDFNSFNGTYLNGSKIEPKVRYPLKTKDIVQMGENTFFFNSVEGNIEYLDMPSFTGSLSMAVNDLGGEIIHNKHEPVLEVNSNQKLSLKSLRSNREKINTLKERLEEFKKMGTKREALLSEIDQKNVEFIEFESYFKMKNYKGQDDVDKMIQSVFTVNSKLEDEISSFQQQIDELQAKIDEAKGEIESNNRIVDELKADHEIMNARDGLIIEIKLLKNKVQEMDELDICGEIKKIESLIQKEEKALEQANKMYRESKFGSAGGFKSKKDKAS